MTCIQEVTGSSTITGDWTDIFSHHIVGKIMFIFKKSSPIPAYFIIYFWPFQTNIITIFTTNKREKCPSRIWCWDLNPQPSEHELPPITTTPG